MVGVVITITAGVEAMSLYSSKMKRNPVPNSAGHSERYMYQRLRDWRYAATREACRSWLCLYRLVSVGKDGNASVYALSRHDLQRWYYVNQLRPTQMQHKYLMEHGVYSDRKNLITWLNADAQKLEKLDFNE